MSKAMELIVAGYVTTRDLRALSELLAHRRKMLDDLRGISSVDAAKAIQDVKDELAIIEAGMEQLKPPLGSVAGERAEHN
ncbi:hypothetical protein A5906_30705 [Bradyrhizobium sacchari]|uniref:Uncharacterized protein n=1 Tax=Bradyrhizobium sacchari TaxID=1399419 RepID=A0A560JS56_9BRAD|nr:hypothetical protein [Bradyrhizobium sacchari]OPY98930.1 hypothetical protein A5906_30705 [Bradyrhizobium sacchari]TWB60413.1 hypothetical protein FBZ94_104638 [Bradyrhizobium sacchari]TWB73777.1 hypothetical protein FBZ95_10527 [Bradyrhizobium sacchari]